MLLATYFLQNHAFLPFSKASSETVATYNIYNDSLARGWREYSSANVDTRDNRAVYSGRRAVSFQSQNTRSLLYFFSPQYLDVSNFDTLQLAVRGSRNDQEYGIYLVDKQEKPITGPIRLSDVGPALEKNTWHVYSIPLSLLLPQQKMTKGLVIKGLGNHLTETIFVDEIKFINSKSPQPSTTPGATLSPSATPKPTVQATPTPTPAPTPKPTATPQPPTSGGWWKPTPDQPIHWHWQLSQDFEYPRDMVNGVTVYDIDGEYATKELVDKLHASGPNVIVICYIDAGVFENYRSDADRFPKSVIGKTDVGWDGSYWLDIRQQDIILPIMRDRMVNWCKNKGFDAVEPDETEVWSNDSGFNITKEQNNDYNRKIAEMAHSLGLSVGLKGNTTETPDLWPYFDWTLNEECWQYKECEVLKTSFIDNGKAVFNIEYKADPNCTKANLWHMNSAKRDLNLVGPTHKSYLYQPCKSHSQNSW